MNKQQAVLLTGATGGIGHAIAKQLIEGGYFALLSGRNEKKLKAMCQTLGDQSSYIVADINDSACYPEIKQACQQHQISILINNAGINSFQLLKDLDPDMINQIVHTNLSSQILLTQYLLPWLETRDKPQIVNIGSSFGSIGFPGYSVYCASKFGLRGFTEALQREYADTKLQIKYFAPRATETSINSPAVVNMNRELGTAMDKPELVARELITFIQGGKTSCYIGWPEKLFVKLNSILPAIVSGALAKQLPVIKKYAQA